jgi:ATP/maltotriose-dependent transcriptional regulator MalT
MDANDLLATASARYPMDKHVDSLSGSPFEHALIDGEPYVVKHLGWERDWIARALGDRDCWTWTLWRTGLLAALPDCVDHTIVAMSRDPATGDVVDTVPAGTAADVDAAVAAAQAAFPGWWDTPAARRGELLAQATAHTRAHAAELAGQLEEAEARLERALALAGRGAGRPERALAALALGRVRQALGHAEAARALLREARQELAACPDPGRLGAQLSAAEALVGAARRGAGSAAGEPPEELTERELAVLRLLGSQLSRREIADALYVSDNTVKTHVRSIFRKLDAASRDEAVERGRELALL